MVQSTGKLPKRLLGKSNNCCGCKANVEKQSVLFFSCQIARAPLLALRKIMRKTHFAYSEIPLAPLLVLWKFKRKIPFTCAMEFDCYKFKRWYGCLFHVIN